MSTDDVPGVTFGVLNGAADYITERGWLQGMFGWAGGSVCAVGAINVARGCPETYCHNLEVAAEALGVKTTDGPWASVEIERWNDSTGRTKTEVVSHLRAAAHIVRHDLEAPVLNEWAG